MIQLFVSLDMMRQQVRPELEPERLRHRRVGDLAAAHHRHERVLDAGSHFAKVVHGDVSRLERGADERGGIALAGAHAQPRAVVRDFLDVGVRAQRLCRSHLVRDLGLGHA